MTGLEQLVGGRIYIGTYLYISPLSSEGTSDAIQKKWSLFACYISHVCWALNLQYLI